MKLLISFFVIGLFFLTPNFEDYSLLFSFWNIVAILNLFQISIISNFVSCLLIIFYSLFTRIEFH